MPFLGRTQPEQYPFARPGAVPEGAAPEPPQPAVVPSRQLLHQQLPGQAAPVDPGTREVDPEEGR